jgi:hypothetical protein
MRDPCYNNLYHILQVPLALILGKLALAMSLRERIQYHRLRYLIGNSASANVLSISAC